MKQAPMPITGCDVLERFVVASAQRVHFRISGSGSRPGTTWTKRARGQPCRKQRNSRPRKTRSFLYRYELLASFSRGFTQGTENIVLWGPAQLQLRSLSCAWK